MMINLLSHPVVLRIGFLIALLGVWPPSEADASNLPECSGDYWDNCQGTYQFAMTLEIYVGEWKDNKYHGQGTLTYPGATFSGYVGEWKDGKSHGQATFISPAGDKYVGEWKDGLANGRGTRTNSNGEKLVGEFKDGKFVGEYKEKKRNGQGSTTLANGDKYVGEFKDDQYNGQGTYTWANGTKYVGEFKDGKRNGQGAFTNANGDKYVGEFKDDQYNGQGTSTFAGGTKYVGEFKDDKRNGQGTATFANGEKYVGDWKDNEPNGQGTTTLNNGDKYVGEFKDLKRNGLVTVSYAIGDAFSGNYTSDKRQGQGTYTWKDGSKYVGQWADGVPTEDGLHTSAQGLALEDVKYTNTATYYGDGTLKSADVLTYEAPAVVAQQTMQQTVQVVQPISPVNADTGKRVALVIGNGSYKNVALLPNPSNDAEAMAAMLSGMGFDVVKGVDLDRSGMEKLIGTFAEKASDAKVSLFFYAGHAIQVDGKNYLMPIDAALKTATSVEFELLEVEQKIVRFMGGETAIILLDSCRDNPLKKEFAQVARSAKVSRGLAQLSIDAGQQLIGFATSPGEVAEDGEGKNSPFTTALLKFLPTPGLEIEQAMKRVKNEVYEATGKKQMPWHNSAMRQDFFFVPAALSGTDAVITQTQPSQSATDPAAQAWGIIQNTTSVAVLDTFIKEYDASSIYVKIAKAKLEELRKSQISNGE